MTSSVLSQFEVDGIQFDLEWSDRPMTDVERLAALGKPGFGTVFSDHMMVVKWTEGIGWGKPKVTARVPFLLDPAAAVLHYAQEIFEGLKAYRGPKGETLLFRPERNAQRFAASAGRMAMAEVPEDLFLAAVKSLTAIDHAWVPDAPGSLYLRPFMFASEAFLGVRPAREYTFCVIASPAGDYFGSQSSGLRIWVETMDSRAAPGGTGAAKCGGNYAAGLSAQAMGAQNGCQQVCYLDATEHRWIEELGGMNVMFMLDGKTLVTPPLGGTILPGITRNSLFTLAAAAGLAVEERPYSFDELQADIATGRLTECFACGTAAVIAPIGELRHAGGRLTIGSGQAGPITQSLRQQLMEIQTGRTADRFGWVRDVKPMFREQVTG